MSYDVLMTTNMELAWDGYVNARDLGGLPTSLSRTGTTVPGRIARGPRRERLTPAGWEAARAWGLTSIVDLRCSYEVGKQDGDPSTLTEILAELAITSAPTEDHSDREFQKVCFPILDSPEYWSHNWRLQPHLVRAALEAIASANPGVLVHCSAGRDRTGMISALILGNAGVEPQAVANDYAASVRAMAGIASHAPTVDDQAKWSQKTANEWLNDKLPIVRDVAVNAQDILDSLNVSAATRESLRAKLIDC
ncbi:MULTISPECIES: tyrosine-protein phosphatase [Glutamicibacter]|uniref:Tyrosine specific protein phosphatases domain-containing protein n=1 Tax=Glutamicibacter arilaitensis (strain DSM 16368 / CIP 108037 / IAM 15318 / JCM 13566 / NCIMB 14258 / Re117) TaxID=861360 RepID=A0ABM9PUZ8_GLUAR|nr:MULTISPECIES: tyrosine-protein phosphatase [Glutamicibacter]CBT75112.1 conserved hypothetical protein [Glutamicibacter arilaitensis Re117]